jgi:hypothetical protein
MRLKILILLFVSSFFVVVAQTATTAKVVDYSIGGGSFSVELKGCTKNNDANTNIVCNFIFTNKGAIDFTFGNYSYVSRLFRAYDSAGTQISVDQAAKGNSGWNGDFAGTFASQLPTRVRIGFKLPAEDTVVTLLDLIGDKVVRFAQIPVAIQ